MSGVNEIIVIDDDSSENGNPPTGNVISILSSSSASESSSMASRDDPKTANEASSSDVSDLDAPPAQTRSSQRTATRQTVSDESPATGRDGKRLASGRSASDSSSRDNKSDSSSSKKSDSSSAAKSSTSSDDQIDSDSDSGSQSESKESSQAQGAVQKRSPVTKSTIAKKAANVRSPITPKRSVMGYRAQRGRACNDKAIRLALQTSSDADVSDKSDSDSDGSESSDKGKSSTDDSGSSDSSDAGGAVQNNTKNERSSSLKQSLEGSDSSLNDGNDSAFCDDTTSSSDSDDSDASDTGRKRRGKPARSSPRKRVKTSQRIHVPDPNANTARCPICFTRVPDESIDIHTATCGQNLIGEFQGSTVRASGAHGSLPDGMAIELLSTSDSDSSDVKRSLEQDKQKSASVALKTRSVIDSDKNASSGNDRKMPAKRNDRKMPAKRDGRKMPEKCPPKLTRDSSDVGGVGDPPSRVARKPSREPETVVAAPSIDPTLPRFTRGGGKLTRGGAKRKFGLGQEAKALEPTNWKEEVDDALRHVQQRKTKRRNERLKKALDSKNALLGQLKPNNENLHRFPLLNPIVNASFDSSHLKDQDHPLPRDEFTTIFLKRHFTSPNDDKTDSSDDNDSSDQEEASSERKKAASGKEPNEENAPLVIDVDEESTSKKIDASPSKIAEFNAREKIGVGYEQTETDEEIDEVLERVQHLGHDRNEVHRYLALLLQEEVARIKGRFDKTNQKMLPRRVHDTPYQNIMSSFRDLFCRRCLTYDCNVHGLAEDYDPSVQADIAMHKEETGFWKDRMPMMCLPVTQPGNVSISDSTNDSNHEQSDKATSGPDVALSESQQLICQRLYHVYQGDLGKVSSAMGISQRSVSRQVRFEPLQHSISASSPTNENRKDKRTNVYNPAWIKSIVETKSHPFFYPCHHNDPCSDTTCTCIQNGFFCTKHCLWNHSSRNFFRGCNCNSKCTTKSCPCFASNRECDPDLCKKCGTCSDAPNKRATVQSCQNDHIGMRRHEHLLLGKSSIAGWGLFTKLDLKKGDYVHEYLGELIPHNEAEKRGAIYDERNQTYLFDLTTDFAVDALRKGNKTRFINHSRTPNVAPRQLVVNGDFRIGFFAQKDIPAHTELFFDYGSMFFSSKSTFAPRTPEKR